MTDFANSHNPALPYFLNDLAQKNSLDQIGIAPLKKPITIDFYEKWLLQKYHGQMKYLQEHLELKKNPHLLGSSLQSVISVAQSYFPAPQPYTENSLPARIALYSRNEDYHFWLKEKLLTLCEELKSLHPEHTFLPYVDSGPLLERDLAYQNRLGWFGKNTCLIHPSHGSLFFVAEILTSLPCEPISQEPLPDLCGKCRRCLDICPTKALETPRLMNAERCISYLTIEAKEVPPKELRAQMGDWFFGCDLCQTVCPWNEKVFRKKNIEKSTALTSTRAQVDLTDAERQQLCEYFRFLLTASHKKIQKYHYGSSLLRAGAKGLKRNALIVIANKRLVELSSEVALLTEGNDLAELAQWTLSQLVD